VSWRRQPPASPPNRRAALLQDLLSGVGALRQAPDIRAAQITTLAREALVIDSESSALRIVAADLQRLADTWSSSTADVRRSKIDAIASAIAAETTHSLASPPMLPTTVAAPLAGAFADALRRGGTR
jgi:hypothetical protein